MSVTNRIQIKRLKDKRIMMKKVYSKDRTGNPVNNPAGKGNLGEEHKEI